MTTTKAKAPARPPAATAAEAQVDPWAEPPCTHGERLQCIRALGKRINEHVQFMCRIGRLNGTSPEAKERAVTAFYERMILVESQLGRIQEDLLLG
jgi:hypothetical protein